MKTPAYQASKIAPAVYLDGPRVLTARVVRDFAAGGKAVFVVEKKLLEKLRGGFAGILASRPRIVFFGGECSREEIARIVRVSTPADVFIAAGGGKTLDTSKIVAERLGARLMTVPTSCATCAAFTAIAPVYTPDGRKLATFDVSRAPDVCVADYEILIRQPSRLMAAGVADAVAKYYETAASAAGNPSAIKDPSVLVSLAISREILRLARECSRGALEAISSGKITRDFRRAVYLAVALPGLVSGIGGKKCRTAAAHALCNGLTHAPSARGALHGEKVGWGLLVQSMILGKKKEAAMLAGFLGGLGLPVTLGEMGIRDFRGPEFQKAAAVALSPGESMRFMGINVGAPRLFKAVSAVEKMPRGRFRRL